ncbi:MAG TPA: hypothetical protein VN065_08415 [Bradyrhizobium sp.]|nr:hypothetical protein [Bradyrhizobium sp.]
MAVSILDDPDGLMSDFSIAMSGFSLIESGAFAWTRHSSLIRLISSRVVKSFPAMRSIRNRPRAASRRNPDTVIDPSGNANFAAIESRRGASGATFPSVEYMTSQPSPVLAAI